MKQRSARALHLRSHTLSHIHYSFACLVHLFSQLRLNIFSSEAISLEIKQGPPVSLYFFQSFYSCRRICAAFPL